MIKIIRKFSYQNKEILKAIDFQNVNKKLIKSEYAVRGMIPIRAGQIEQEIKEGSKKYEFSQLDYCSIGNPQAFGQSPISFNREVLSLIVNPNGLEQYNFKTDVKERGRYYINNLKQDIGGQCEDSRGYKFIRRNIKEFIVRRDNIADDNVQNEATIYMSAGASDMISQVLTAIIQDCNDGVMTPIPQYPLYSALLTLNNASLIPYYLNEENCWDINIEDLNKQFQQSKLFNKKIKAFVLINPGNPTGQVISYQTIQAIVKFCYDNQILLLADEVYQENIYINNKSFHSARKVILNSPYPYNQTQCISFHSTSKGFIGECGFRGGYSEFLNFSDELLMEFYKMRQINQSANSVGQILTDLMCNPPCIERGESQETIDLYNNEKNEILQSLKEKAMIVTDSLNQMTNITCQISEGAMYAFPKVTFSQKAIQAAQQANLNVDAFYCLQALEKTGIVLVPGSGFKQKENTFHFRITILIRPTQRLQNSLLKFKQFNQAFHNQYQ